jgi:spore coat polysaccharide biosynthesis protein SpsF
MIQLDRTGAHSAKIVAIIQARMGSKRFPGKVMEPLAGMPLLGLQISRLRASETLNEICVATTTEANDDIVTEYAASLGATVVRGSESDVLSRFVAAGAATEASYVVRLTADCPLTDPNIVDRVVTKLLETGDDYVSNTVERTFPLGLDCEAMTLAALAKADSASRTPWEREHVTPYLYSGARQFATSQLTLAADLSSMRWTVDTREDLEYLTQLTTEYGPKRARYASWFELLQTALLHPELNEINSKVRQTRASDGAHSPSPCGGASIDHAK